MTRYLIAGAFLLLTGPWLAGCSTTPAGDYSSLPPAPQHPPRTAQAAEPLPPTDGTAAPGAGFAEPDLLDRIRAGYTLQDVDNRAVDREVERYRAQPDYLDRTFRRGARYLHYIVGEIEKRGLPMELALLPVVESAFNPVAYSRSRASGLWQFMPSTGRHYGLEQSWWLDERRDVIESTQAALTYLQYLSRYFDGDWFLAIAAYNGGEGTVRNAIANNARAGRPTNFFSLRLRAETRDYVPKLLAMRRIVGNPAAYGLQFMPIPDRPYFEVVEPERQVHIGNAAELAGVSRDDMFALNPAYNRQTTPPHGPHRLLLPVDRAPVLRAAMLTAEGVEKLAVPAPPKPRDHYVRRGETLSSIARSHGVSVAELKAVNGLDGSRIMPGQKLAIPGSGAPSAVSPPRSDVARVEQVAAAPAPVSARTHTVQSGDTLWGIARQHGVTVPELAAANGIETQSRLALGMRLTIPGGAPSYARLASAPESVRMTYKVRRGDTLSAIARRFEVTIRELMTWNQLRSASMLRAGQRLVLYVDPSRFSGG